MRRRRQSASDSRSSRLCSRTAASGSGVAGADKLKLTAGSRSLARHQSACPNSCAWSAMSELSGLRPRSGAPQGEHVEVRRPAGRPLETMVQVAHLEQGRIVEGLSVEADEGTRRAQRIADGRLKLALVAVAHEQELPRHERAVGSRTGRSRPGMRRCPPHRRGRSSRGQRRRTAHARASRLPRAPPHRPHPKGAWRSRRPVHGSHSATARTAVRLT